MSSCLLGLAVRYDGTDRHFDFATGVLADRFELVSICPEVEFGLGVPRETIQLEGDPASPRLVGTDSRRDLTDEMEKWCARRVRQLEALELSGYVFKRHSPSCGPARVKLWPDLSSASLEERARARPRRRGTGLFARALLEAYPKLPFEDEASLLRPGRKERFLARVEAYARRRAR